MIIRVCITCANDVLAEDIVKLFSKSSAAKSTLVFLDNNTPMRMDNTLIKSNIDQALIQNKNLLCIYCPASPPRSFFFDVIIRLEERLIFEGNKKDINITRPASSHRNPKFALWGDILKNTTEKKGIFQYQTDNELIAEIIDAFKRPSLTSIAAYREGLLPKQKEGNQGFSPDKPVEKKIPEKTKTLF